MTDRGPGRLGVAIDEIVHGTTVATNTMLEYTGATTALLTTAGFRDVLELRRVRGLDHAMYKVEAPDDLDDLERKLSDYGCTVRRMSAGDELGMGQGIRFLAPTGHTLELVHAVEKVGNLLPKTNPPPAPMGMIGIHPPRVDHVFLTCEDVDGATDFFMDVLGFRLTEQL